LSFFLPYLFPSETNRYTAILPSERPTSDEFAGPVHSEFDRMVERAIEQDYVALCEPLNVLHAELGAAQERIETDRGGGQGDTPVRQGQ
jgi:hypothetical protein